MTDFNQSQTKINLARAFAGECQAGARYQFIAQKAMTEDKKNIQMLFKNLAKNEMAHAKRFWVLIAKHGGKPQENIEIKAGYPFEDGELLELIKFAANNEKSESTSIYPSFSKIAEDEGFKDVAQAFKLVAMVENDHFMTIDELYNKLKAEALYKCVGPQQWKCSQCGYVETKKEAFKTCPLCLATQNYIDLSFLQTPKNK